MLILINLLYLIHSTTFAQTGASGSISRAPAVLDNSCDLNVATDNKPLIEVHRDLCKKVRDCMGSAPDEDLAGLKKLEALACKNELNPVTTTIPKLDVNKALKDDNSRQEKFKIPREATPAVPAGSAIDK